MSMPIPTNGFSPFSHSPPPSPISSPEESEGHDIEIAEEDLTHLQVNDENPERQIFFEHITFEDSEEKESNQE